MFIFLFEILMRIAFWAKSIYDDKKRFMACYVTLIGIVYTLLFALDSNDTSISIISAIIGAVIVLISVINVRFLTKIFIKLFFDNEK